MAKKKSSAKKAVKKTAKKVVKKVAKQVSKKSPAKKSAGKVAKKAPVKKAAAKAAPKAVKKTAAKKAAPKKAAPKKVAKAPAKKSPAVKTKAPAMAHLVKPAAKKLVDLSDFVTPLDDRLIVQTSGSDRMSASGLLYIPDTVADVSGNLHGTVVSVGRGHVNKKGHLTPMELKVGDKVVFSQYSGSKIKLKNEDLVILRETEVMGVVEK
ncbi:co-chaperone GroES [Bdellovibrio sp. KM01]|uniref:co-chaperone GroES n=1 Tax=Bdellovibrio sp. KM01 TaxID=2748865 RepID=UPI0015E94A0C|nr:co-chaperone GroES [Bdellovibrio sp. KM01]QLY25020.1 co-chaperone GroES [Bdellovibrio sp. KM01]